MPILLKSIGQQVLELADTLKSVEDELVGAHIAAGGLTRAQAKKLQSIDISIQYLSCIGTTLTHQGDAALPIVPKGYDSEDHKLQSLMTRIRTIKNEAGAE